MSISHKLLFSLNIKHDFYTDQRCNDFLLTMTPETQQLLNKHRCIPKFHTNGINVFMQVNADNTPLLPFQDGSTFDFTLRLQNTAFGWFTDLTEFKENENPIFRNTPDAEQLSLGSRTLFATDKFYVDSPEVEDEFTLHDHLAEGLAKDDFVLADLPQATPDRVDLKSKVITVNTVDMDVNHMFSVTYPIKAAIKNNIFSHVQLIFDNSFPEQLNSAKSYHISFKSKQAKWLYYVISDIDNSSTANQLTIKDNGAEDKVVFEEVSVSNNPDDEIATELKERYPNLHLTAFISEKLISCKQRSKKNLQLHLNNDPVIETLPLPAINNLAQSVNGQEPPEDRLFHIVKYLTTTF
ncbi:MAG: hypothetical protein DWQ10_04525 [Calditrichaeota bacterium]|nr:MAG: hypothetical protein DWQ10_04525 [Calditrichota bacterium]